MQILTPNRSLNRTLHSVPAFVLAKTLAQIPSRCSGPVSFDVRPRKHALSMPATMNRPAYARLEYTHTACGRVRSAAIPRAAVGPGR